MSLNTKLSWVTIVILQISSHTCDYPEGTPAAACDNLMPQHGNNMNSTFLLPFELDMEIFEDPGIPTDTGILSHTHSYTPGLTYNCKYFLFL